MVFKFTRLLKIADMFKVYTLATVNFIVKNGNSGDEKQTQTGHNFFVDKHPGLDSLSVSCDSGL